MNVSLLEELRGSWTRGKAVHFNSYILVSSLVYQINLRCSFTDSSDDFCFYYTLHQFIWKIVLLFVNGKGVIVTNRNTSLLSSSFVLNLPSLFIV